MHKFWEDGTKDPPTVVGGTASVQRATAKGGVAGQRWRRSLLAGFNGSYTRCGALTLLHWRRQQVEFKKLHVEKVRYVSYVSDSSVVKTSKAFLAIAKRTKQPADTKTIIKFNGRSTAVET